MIKRVSLDTLDVKVNMLLEGLELMSDRITLVNKKIKVVELKIDLSSGKITPAQAKAEALKLRKFFR